MYSLQSAVMDLLQYNVQFVQQSDGLSKAAASNQPHYRASNSQSQPMHDSINMRKYCVLRVVKCIVGYFTAELLLPSWPPLGFVQKVQSQYTVRRQSSVFNSSVCQSSVLHISVVHRSGLHSRSSKCHLHHLQQWCNFFRTGVIFLF